VGSVGILGETGALGDVEQYPPGPALMAPRRPAIFPSTSRTRLMASRKCPFHFSTLAVC